MFQRPQGRLDHRVGECESHLSQRTFQTFVPAEFQDILELRGCNCDGLEVKEIRRDSYESRGSRSVLEGPGVEAPPRYATRQKPSRVPPEVAFHAWGSEAPAWSTYLVIRKSIRLESER